MFGGNLSLRGNLGDNAGASLMFEKLIWLKLIFETLFGLG
jgi:hypothetical protein